MSACRPVPGKRNERQSTKRSKQTTKNRWVSKYESRGEVPKQVMHTSCTVHWMRDQWSQLSHQGMYQSTAISRVTRDSIKERIHTSHHTCAYMYLHAYIHKHIYIHAYANIHTFIHTYIHSVWSECVERFMSIECNGGVNTRFKIGTKRDQLRKEEWRGAKRSTKRRRVEMWTKKGDKKQVK